MEKLAWTLFLLLLSACGPNDEKVAERWNTAFMGDWAQGKAIILKDAEGRSYLVEHWVNDLFKIRTIEVQP